MKRGTKALAVLIATCLAAAVVPWTVQAQEAGQRSSALRPVGRLDRVPADAVAIFGPVIVPKGFHDPVDADGRDGFFTYTTGTVIVLPQARQVWQFFPFTNFEQKTAVVVRDLDSLRIRHSFVHPGLFKRAGVQTAGDWTSATDGDRRLFLVNEVSTHVFEFDLTTFSSRAHPVGLPIITAPFTAAPLLSFRVAGMTWDRTDGSLLVLVGGIANGGAANRENFVGRLKTSTGEWTSRRIRACDGQLPQTNVTNLYGMPLVATADAVFVPCQSAGYAGLVVRLPRTSLPDPLGPEEFVAGPTYIDGALADPDGARIYIFTYKSGEIWVFDTRSMAFVGVITASRQSMTEPRIGYGVDEETGRVFFLSEEYGLGIVDGRFFPVPQARRFPLFASVGQERIWSDARTGRLFVLPGTGQSKDHAYTVYAVDRAPAPPPPPEPDRNTADIDEAPGRTEAKYFSSAGGYGVRALAVKGIATVAPAPSVGVQSPTAQAIEQYVNSKCGYTDRELVAGRVAQAQYDTVSASAFAAAVDVDGRTKQDLEHLSRCDVTARNSGTEVFRGIYGMAPDLPDEGRGWRYIPATCSSGEGGAEARDGDDQGEQSLGTSRVECPEPGGKLHAEAYADLTNGAVKVGNAFTVVDIEKVTGGGVVSTVTSLAREIDIAGVIRIGEIRSQAVSRANGRPSKAPMSTYSTLVRGVTIGAITVCDGDCDTATVVDLLNRAASGKAYFEASPGLDQRFLKGSPGGAQTAVQKSLERQVSDQALAGDSTSEVPGLQLTVFNDNFHWGRARQVYQFAGVTSTANYNIVPLPSFADLLDDDQPSRPDGLDLEVPDGSNDTALAIGLDGLGGGSGGAGSGGGIVGGINRALRAVVDGFRLLVTDPRRAFLVLTAWAVLVVPVALNRRRRLLIEARHA